MDARRLEPALTLPTALATVLSLVGLAERPPGYDERVTARLVTAEAEVFAERILGDQLFGALYYLLARGWSTFGSDPFTLRVLSVLFAVATVPLCYLVARRLFGRWVAAVTATLLAMHPLFIRYAQEARPYALVLFLVTLATYLLLRALDHPSHGRWLAYGLVAAVAIYAHLFAALVVTAHLLTLIVRRPLPRRGVAIIVAVAVAVAPFAIPVAFEGPERSFIPATSLPWIRTVGDQLAGGFGMWPPVYALVAAALCGVAVLAWRPRTPALVCLAWLAVPVVLVVGVSLVKPMLLARYLIVVLPALVMLVAAGIAMIRPREARYPVVLVLVGLAAVRLGWWYAGAPEL
jgi:mannosyltransferase